MAIPRSEYEQRMAAEKIAAMDAADKAAGVGRYHDVRAASDNAARAAHDRVVRPWAHWR